MSFLSRTEDQKMAKPKQRVTVTLEMSDELIQLIDQLKVEYGAQSRSRTIELLLNELLSDDSEKSNT